MAKQQIRARPGTTRGGIISLAKNIVANDGFAITGGHANICGAGVLMLDLHVIPPSIQYQIVFN